MRISLAAIFFSFSLLAQANAAPAPSLIAKAVADPARPADNRAADPLRKPAQTLAFAGVRPGMTVGEFYPGGGYFTRMISDVVGPAGHVYGIENRAWGGVKPDEALLADKHWSNVTMISRSFGTVEFSRPLDLAWITQNYHDLKIAKESGTKTAVDTAAFDRAVFKALKPGGIFFVSDHEGRPGMTDADIEKLHRISKAHVIREATAAGFRLVAEGRFLRNAGDDHSKPIFDKSIKGHTDQFALKFVKPKR